MSNTKTRREMLVRSMAVVGAASLVTGAPSRQTPAAAHAFVDGFSPTVRYCLNTSTIRGQEIPLDGEIDLAAAAGYDSVEPWIREIRKFMEDGGKLADLRKRLDDHGLSVDSAIGFATWIVDDDQQRSQGLEVLKSDMELLQQLGGTRIAAPPAGATEQSDLDLGQAAERYAAALRVGEQMGVHPQLELWGFSKTLSRLGELMYVAIESGHKDASVLLDVYHIYKGGSDFEGLRLIDGSAVQVLHMNDYPDIPRSRISDADRVYPGEGVAPLTRILQTLFENGFSGVLSLELFNRQYWREAAASVLEKGLAAMKNAVETATHV